jgi:hypothetical protein
MPSVQIGDKLTLNIDRLVETRLLLQASSGGGKTHAVRKILEATHGYVQHIVIDPEGEFSILRDKYDYILAGEDGDNISTHPQHAALLARRVLELKANIIISLYEMQPRDRVEFTKRFVSALVDAPKELWHPCLVVIDEGHIFAPEGKENESTGAIIDLASRGRKRGYALVIATQRPAKLSKSVTAELQNKLIGLANQQIDRKRGAEELGFTDKAEIIQLRDLEQGTFFAVGPAFERGVNRIKIGKTETNENRTKGAIYTPPPARRTIQAVLSKLSDIPVEAKKNIDIVAQLRKENSDLKASLRSAAPAKAVVTEKIVTVTAPGSLPKEDKVRILRELQGIVTKIQAVVDLLGRADKTPAKGITPGGPARTVESYARRVAVEQPAAPAAAPAGAGDDRNLLRCSRAILAFLSSFPNGEFSRQQIGVLTNYKHTGGNFSNAISELVTVGLVRKIGKDNLQITDEGFRFASTRLGNDFVGPAQAIANWKSRLGKCEKSILEVLDADREAEYTKEDLGRATGYEGKGGSFSNAVSKLYTIGLIEKTSNGNLKFSDKISSLL